MSRGTTGRGVDAGSGPVPQDYAPRAAVPPDLVVLWDDQPPHAFNLLSVGMQEALARAGVPRVRRRRSGSVRLAARVLGRAGLVRPLFKRPRGRSFTTVAWASHARVFPDAYWRRIVPWVYDCWAPMFDAWESFFRTHRIDTAFFGARDAARHFARAVPGLQAHWLPEACDPALYRPDRPLVERSIHVLEVGRKHEAVHTRIRPTLAAAGRSHRFAIDGTRTPIFAGIDDLYRGLGDTAVMLCFPKSVTHPAEAGGVETLTQRYFEAIGSGCLTVGVCPQELRDLFGFDPVIGLDATNPGAHLLSLLDRLAEYQEHVAQCRRRLLEVGTFDVRARQLLALLAEPAAEPAPEIVVRAGTDRAATGRREPARAE